MHLFKKKIVKPHLNNVNPGKMTGDKYLKTIDTNLLQNQVKFFNAVIPREKKRMSFPVCISAIRMYNALFCIEVRSTLLYSM